MKGNFLKWQAGHVTYHKIRECSNKNIPGVRFGLPLTIVELPMSVSELPGSTRTYKSPCIQTYTYFLYLKVKTRKSPNIALLAWSTFHPRVWTTMNFKIGLLRGEMSIQKSNNNKKQIKKNKKEAKNAYVLVMLTTEAIKVRSCNCCGNISQSRVFPPATMEKFL